MAMKYQDAEFKTIRMTLYGNIWKKVGIDKADFGLLADCEVGVILWMYAVHVVTNSPPLESDVLQTLQRSPVEHVVLLSILQHKTLLDSVGQ